MDLSKTITPNSAQLNADDLIAGPVTVTIESVTAGNPEQPVNVNLAEYPGRPYKPSKSMRRVLVALYGPKGDTYAGHRLTLYRDPKITFGRDEVGGIRISHASHIAAPVHVMLTVKRGRKERLTVQPLPDAPSPAWTVPDLPSVDAYRAHYQQRQADGASPDELAAIHAAAQPNTPQEAR